MSKLSLSKKLVQQCKRKTLMWKKQEEICSKSHYQNRLYTVLLKRQKSQNIKYRKINIKHLAYFSVHETEEWECNYMEQMCSQERRTGR